MSNWFSTYNLYVSALDDSDFYKKIFNLISQLDERNILVNYYKAFVIYDSVTKEKLGSITSKDYKLLTPLEEHDKWFIDYANRTFSSSAKSDSSEIEFVRKEENVKIKDNNEIYQKLLSRASTEQKNELDTAVTTIYYFYDNVADINFYIIDYQILGQACYYNNYSGTIRNSYNNNCKW